MWRILVLLIAASCYSSAEQHLLTFVNLSNVTETEAPATPSTTDPGTPGSRIVGGWPAAITRYPSAVQVLITNQLACGGSLITRRHVLSAAHCFYDYRGRPVSASSLSCRVGTATLNQGGAQHRVSMYINHERYNVGAYRDNDISVLVLASTVSHANAAPVAIPRQGDMLRDDAPVWVAGWGHIQEGGPASQVLNEVQVYTINNQMCAQRYRELEFAQNSPFPVTFSMMCTGVLMYGGRDACQGDSGGPVMYGGALVGVTSWGWSCGHPYYPGVNARVSAYSSWINATVTRYNGAPSLGQTSVLLLVISFLASTMFSHKYC